MGSSSRRQFCVVGPVVSQASILSHLCAKYNPNSSPTTTTSTTNNVPATQYHSSSGGGGVCLVAGATLLSEISPFVEYKLQDCVHFPFNNNNATAVPTTDDSSSSSSSSLHRHGKLLVATLCKIKESKQDEWMYELQESDASSTTAGHNNALERFVEGKTDVALQLWSTHLELVKEDPVAERFVQLARSYLARGKDSSTYVQSTADYYTTCVLHSTPSTATPSSSDEPTTAAGGGTAQVDTATTTTQPLTAFHFLSSGSPFHSTTGTSGTVGGGGGASTATTSNTQQQG